MDEVNYEGIADTLKHLGLILRGGFHPHGKDDVEASTVVLIGNAGPDLWQSFPGPDGSGNPLDDWCREVIWYGNKKGAYLYGSNIVEPQLSGHF